MSSARYLMSFLSSENEGMLEVKGRNGVKSLVCRFQAVCFGSLAVIDEAKAGLGASKRRERRLLSLSGRLGWTMNVYRNTPKTSLAVYTVA